MSLGMRLSYPDLLLVPVFAACSTIGVGAGLEAEHNCDWLFLVVIWYTKK